MRELPMQSRVAGDYHTVADAPEPPSSKTVSERHKKICERAINQLQLAETAESQQRRREQEDLQFDRALPEDQWPEGIRSDRAGGFGPDGQTLGARPCLVINKLDQPVQQVINEARNARLGIHIKPKGDGANVEGAEIRQGLIRAIEMDSRAHIARLWALDRAVKCGRGCYRISKKYANDGDFDIDLVVDRILNQASVYLDPFAQQPDWSDGEWALITNDIPLEEYKRRYPDSPIGRLGGEELTGIGNRVPGWIGGSDVDGERTIRVAEYFYVEHTTRTLVLIPGIGKQWKDELKGVELPPDAKTRDVDVRDVKWCVINAEEVLDEEDWEGRYIPIIPVIGKEYNVDGDRCFKGVISNSKDAQRSYNYMRSAQVEAVGLAPKAPWIMAEGQDEGYEMMWDQSNTKNYTRLKYKLVDLNGKPISPPQRNVAEPAIQAISMAVTMADNDIKSTTGRYDASLGKPRSEQSGKAIESLKASGESTTSNYLENLTSVSMHYEAKILLDLMPFVYDRPGRIIRVLGEEVHEDRSVMINQPFVDGPNGQPMPAPPPGMQQRLGENGIPPKPPKEYNLKKGVYGVEVSVGRSFATQRDENAEMLRSIIESAPGLTPMLADLMVEQLDTPIARKAAERLRKLNPQLQDDTEVPPQVQAKMQALEEQQQQLTEALTAANDEIKSQHYKVDKEYDAKLKELETRIRVASIQAQTGMGTTQLKTQSDSQTTEMELIAKEELQRQELEAEARLQAEKLQHEGQMARADHSHEMGVKAGDHVSKQMEREGSEQHEARMKVGDALTQRMSQDADQQHERSTQRTDHEQQLKKDTFADARKHRHDTQMTKTTQQFQGKQADADRKVKEKTAKAKPKAKP